MTKDDRIAFSQKIVSADAEVKALQTASAQLQVEVDKLQKLDTANKNLLDPINALVNGYQLELGKLTGVFRTTFAEQNIQDAAVRKNQNYFFPNDTAVTVPSLSGTNNVWTQLPQFGLGFGLGKSYSEAYPSAGQKEADLINALVAAIAGKSAFVEIELTSGQHCVSGGTCSLPMYTTQATCIAATPTPGIWTPNGTSVISAYPDVVTLKNTILTAVNNLKTYLTNEIPTITQNDTLQTTDNNAALAAINTLVTALNTWIATPDFQAVPGTVTTCVAFYSYNSNLLAPTKLHNTQIDTLSAALTTRLSFIPTRVSQLNTVLGSISQDVSTGSATGSGYYFKRFGLLSLRLHVLTGSLSKLAGLLGASNAQASIVESTKANKATYLSLLPTSALAGNANGTDKLSVVDASLFNVGDQIYIYADGQDELVRGIRSKTGNMLTLSDTVPTKYRTADKARAYKEA